MTKMEFNKRITLYLPTRDAKTYNEKGMVITVAVEDDLKVSLIRRPNADGEPAVRIGIDTAYGFQTKGELTYVETLDGKMPNELKSGDKYAFAFGDEQYCMTISIASWIAKAAATDEKEKTLIVLFNGKESVKF